MATSQSALDAIRPAMERINSLFNTEVFQKRNFDALDQIYTSDARILPPGAPMVSGRDAIKQFWTAAIQALDATSATLGSVDVIPSGDGLVEIGRAELTTSAGATVEAKYVVYWRQEEGNWKWHVDIWNMNA